MPGQRRRRRKAAEEWERQKARDTAAGPWEVVFSTQDEAEWEVFRRRMNASGWEGGDGTEWRIDVWCGRLTSPTTYVARRRALPGAGLPDPGGGAREAEGSAVGGPVAGGSAAEGSAAEGSGPVAE
ncbi:hypothetical protein ACWEQL_09895 [Kitasatospora sp. NPDC004240]